MIVKGLKLANLRAIPVAEFHFQPGFNLIVGVNGVGKTSVLDALRVCLSAVVKRANGLQGNARALLIDDIRIGADATMIECHVRIGERHYVYLRHRPRQGDIPQKAQFIGESPSPIANSEAGGRPLVVFFSTNRAVPSRRTPGRGVASGDVDAAFADAFRNRELRLEEFGAWLKAQQAMRTEHSAAGRMLAACENAVARFLPGYRNLRLSSVGRAQLWIDRGETTLPVRQLSDGERGVLALVLDLTRRLAQANPNFTDPASEAEAVVLIDEIDLHLHPKWQRQIIPNLTGAFPRCQFIATTHSPFVIQALQHGELINLDLEDFGEYADKSIEDIAENVMGVDLPQKSERYLKMMTAAEEYFRLLRASSGDPAKLAEAEERLNELSVPFSDDPAFQALLKLERVTLIDRGRDATS